jgi:hypothetical protein
MEPIGRGMRRLGAVALLVVVLAAALGLDALIGRVTADSRAAAADVRVMETVRRVAAEQRALEQEAALRGAASSAQLDRFAALRGEMDDALGALGPDLVAGRRGAEAENLARSYQHVLGQQLALLDAGFVTSAEQFGATSTSSSPTGGVRSAARS